MSNINTYSTQSELALAAYGTLQNGLIPIADLIGDDVKMSTAQATRFVETWSVVAQYNNDDIGGSGLSATVFEKIDGGERHLAIRGTEATGSDILADGLLALGLPNFLNPQYIALKDHLDNFWLKDGTLDEPSDDPLNKPSAFTVSGHSLGGYIAATVKQNYTQVTDAYLYNAPGVGGPLGNLVDALAKIFELDIISPNDIWNVRGFEGFSLAAGLGYQLGTAVSIQNEKAVNSHSIILLSDALAVHSLYSLVALNAPSLSQKQLNALIDASGFTNNQTLESALDALRIILLNPKTPDGQSAEVPATTVGDRDSFYKNLYDLQDKVDFVELITSAHLTVLPDLSLSDIVSMAMLDNEQGLAMRYALDALNPFALSGVDYSKFNTADQQLVLFDPKMGDGTLTEQYLNDRAAFLARKIWFSTQDIEHFRTTGAQSESRYFEDVTLGYKISQGELSNDVPRYFFGGDGVDSPAASDVADHLYGGGGNDMFTAGKGFDYLEGGIGTDTYIINPDDGLDTILDTDGAGTIKFGMDLIAKGSEGVSAQDWRYLDRSAKWFELFAHYARK